MAEQDEIVEIMARAIGRQITQGEVSLGPRHDGTRNGWLQAADAILSALTAAGCEVVMWRKEPLPDEIDCDREYYVAQWPPLAAEPEYYSILRGPQGGTP